MTAIGPLTTTFAAPSSCGSLSVYQLWKGSQSTYVQGPLYTAGSDNACFPDDYNPSGYYSPGICPQGYTTACSKLSTKSKVTETAVVCCPP
ncbi:hypothetical protein B0T17DRAFT_481286 [Bombardia bombarda]|uniref:Uncharacterized protein n=1 Tax=Bombardia bombarda TaxID=252184 RepID=A0AA40CEP1_9PEZI|nr:hypothetical protein B0T17DRAFT_481286 [Bombardia bombarda]